MTSLIWKGIEFLDVFERYADPRVRNWFLMGSPISPIVITISYLLFVQKLGPWLMRDRPPLKIEKIIILYNVVQVYMATYIVTEAFRTLWFKGNYNFHCIDIDYSLNATEQARAVWVYFMTKFLDLLDTVFFVLRKKQSQVTFLHVYHHTLVFTFGWFITKYYAGGHVAFFGTVNAFVHMIMYTYYLITALHLVNNKSLWWKKYITQLQLIQFIITGLHGVLALFATNCNFPKYLIAFGIPQDIFMFWLFWDFYRKTYMKPNKSKNKLNGTASTNDIKNKKE